MEPGPIELSAGGSSDDLRSKVTLTVTGKTRTIRGEDRKFLSVATVGQLGARHDVTTKATWPSSTADQGEVPLRERAAGAGFQVPLEAACLLFGRELDDHGHGPGSIPSGVATGSSIVPIQSILDVLRDADVVTIGI
jgi:hypothetical protein